MAKETLSAATKRAMKYPGKGAEWFCGFKYSEVTGLGHEVGIHRRDPAAASRLEICTMCGTRNPSVLIIGETPITTATLKCGPGIMLKSSTPHLLMVSIGRNKAALCRVVPRTRMTSARFVQQMC